jgi:DNA-binding transcriptional LysR family regulator
MRIEQRDLEYFAVVAEQKSLGRAAEALSLSQPALSMSLRRLERVAGAKIVRRTPKGIEVTDAGAALLRHVKRLRLAYDDILQEVADIGQGRSGHLRIGTSVGITDLRLEVACSQLLNEASRVSIEVTGGAWQDLFPLVSLGELDFALTSVPAVFPEELVHETVIKDECVIYCSTRHRLARAKRVTLADIAQERWATPTATDGLQILFREYGLPPRKIVLSTALIELRLRTVAATNLLGFNARPVVQQAARRLPLKILRVEGWKPFHRSLGIVYRRDGYLSPTAWRLIELFKAAAQESD